jgi:hypothetical protein
VLKFLLEFSEADFLGIAKKSLLDANGVWSGQTTDHTRVSVSTTRVTKLVGVSQHLMP